MSWPACTRGKEKSWRGRGTDGVKRSRMLGREPNTHVHTHTHTRTDTGAYRFRNTHTMLPVAATFARQREIRYVQGRQT